MTEEKTEALGEAKPETLAEELTRYESNYKYRKERIAKNGLPECFIEDFYD